MIGNSMTFGRRNDVNVEPCGLCFHQYPMLLRFVPLWSVDVVGIVAHAVAEVKVTQVFINSETNPIEAVYYFPLDSNGAVVGFEAEIDGKKIKGVAKAHEEAQQDYDLAVANNQTAFLGEETKADIFKVSVGYLKPGDQAKIVLRYVTEVKNERGTSTIRFCIPTTIAPRYTPLGSDEKGLEIGNIPHSMTSPAPISILVHVGIQGKIASIKSPSHKILMDSNGVSPNNVNWTQATVSLQSQTIDMDRDFVLLVTPEQAHQPLLYLEERSDSVAFMAYLIPSFRLDEQKTELIFVLDRSGSMSGSKIMLAKKALKLFLHSLPADCYFNVVSFGGTYEFLFKQSAAFSFPYVFRENSSIQSPQSAKYTNETLRFALAYADQLSANMGGTEIMQPLQKVYESEKITGYLRQVFVLTDGEVSNTEEVIGLTKAHAHETRVFTLGIGNSASHHLVEGVATAGGGTSTFATDNEPIDRKVLEQLKDAILPALTNVQITWEGLSLQKDEVEINSPASVNKEKTLMGYGKSLGDGSVKVNAIKKYQQAPEKIPPVFDGSQSLIFGVFTDVSLKPSAAIITAESPHGPLSIKIEVSDANKVGQFDMIHKLAAIKIVREIEMKLMALSFTRRDVFSRLDEHEETTKHKKEIIDIAVREGIASKYTSFIAVDSISNEVMGSKHTLSRRVVPSKLTHGNTQFHYRQQPMFGSSGSTVAKSGFMFGAGGTVRPQQTLGFGSQAAKSGSLFGARASIGQQQQQMFGSTVVTAAFGAAPIQNSNTAFGQTTFSNSSIPVNQSVSQQQQQQMFGSTVARAAFSVAPIQNYNTAFGQTTFSNSSLPVNQSDSLTNTFGAIAANFQQTNKQEMDKLYQIISFQSFDGSFIYDSNLIQILELMVDVTKQEATKNAWDLVAWTTVLVITFLQIKLLERKDSWDLVSAKAVKWLNKNYGTVLNAMVERARQLFNS